MKLALLVYLASTVDSLSFILGTIGFLGLTVYFFILGVIHFSDYGTKTYSFDNDEEIEKQKNISIKYTGFWKLAATIFPILIFIAVFLPSERTLYLMAGAYATEQIASNERVQKIGSDVLEVIETKLGEMKQGDSDKKEEKADAEG
ncbi:hypothetical protein PY247_10390 [Acinetobacter proteolyticus]|nr:hypothetical protein [Acinetobacter proteolyticus]WEI20083.1 hypothetical protein PY247_10390 [Acinetobacter proteolyticus]